MQYAQGTQDLLRFSGIVCLLLAGVFLVWPAWKHFGRYSSISDLAYLPEFRRRFAIGFVLVGIAQFVFALAANAVTGDNLFTVSGFLLFMVSALAFTSLAAVSYTQFPKSHVVLAEVYFFGSALAVLIIAAGLLLSYPLISMFSTAVVLCFGVQAQRIKRHARKPVYRIELLHAALSFPWVLMVSFLL